LQREKVRIQQRDKRILTTIIKRCCEIKAHIVEQDEREGGVRAILNLGHTFGHAIEAELGYGVWLHGEAVSVGMVQACSVACLRGWLTQTEVDEVVELLQFFDLPTAGPTSMKLDDYLPHMAKDKKVLDGTMRFILPTKLGTSVVVSDVTQAELKAVLN